MSIDDILFDKLERRKEKGLLRFLKSPQSNFIDFSSNNYLGLSTNKELQQKIDKAYQKSAQKIIGSGGSRLLHGNYPQIESLEHLLLKIHGKEAALVCNSGYNANLSVFSCIPQKGDIVLYDEYIHACVKDGLRLSLSKFDSFKHNDIEDLEKKLLKFSGFRIFIAIEGIYSMDGDTSPLKKICLLAERYKAKIIIDEAHSTGIYGQNGAGIVSQLGLDDKVYIKIHTFGKAIGVHGAVVSCNTIVKDYLINFARSFIYTTSLPLHTVIAIQESYKFIDSHPEIQESLFKVIDNYQQISNTSSNHSPIQTYITGSNESAKNIASKLQSKKIEVYPILSPTVPEGKERIRICLHAYNKIEDLENLCLILSQQD